MAQIKKMKINYKEIILGIIFCVLLYVIFLSESLKPNEKFRVTFFDVGQGDATLIETPKNLKILIDGGLDNKISNQLGKHFSFFDNDIDMVVATHDDADHIYGLIKVLEKYKVSALFVSLPNSRNELMQKIISIAKSKDVKIVTIEKPGIVKTEDGVIIKFLFPTINLDGIEDGNSASVVTQIIYNMGANENESVKIMLTGDLGINGENYLVDLYGEELKSNILKLGHHGSDTSSGVNFLQYVEPEIAIVSAGANNKFGHPHKSVIDLVSKFGAKVLETAQEGNIHFEF